MWGRMKSDWRREKNRVARKESFTPIDKRLIFRRLYPGCPLSDVLSKRSDKPAPPACVEIPCAENTNCFGAFFPRLYAEDSTPAGAFNKRERETLENKRLVADYLGEDPRPRLRDPALPYVGLQNLGSTCYANSLLQALNADPQFRSIILGWKAEDASEQARSYATIMTQWQRLFVDLNTSAWKQISPRDFIQSLHIRTDVQQDPAELMTSMLQLLERSLDTGDDGLQLGLKQYLHQVSKGKLSYQTICPQCGAQSRSEDTFTQLKVPLNPRENVTLGSLLQETYTPEKLPERECDVCHVRSDTERRSYVSMGPLSLAVELLRFSFDQKTLRTKKISNNVVIPMKLDLAKCGCAPETAHDLRYRLSSVVCHIGSDAANGHYIAYVVRYEDETGDKYSFWRFDDSVVTKCETKNEAGDLLRPFTAEWYESVQVSGAMARAQLLMKQSGLDPQTAMKIVADDSLFSRETAYIVFYQHESCPIQTTLPESLQDISAQNLRVALQMADGFAHEGELALQELLNRRSRIESLRRIIEAPIDADHFNWISVDWLEEFFLMHGLRPMKPIDNSSIVCPHGGVACGRSASRKMRRISNEAWSILVKDYQGGPELTEQNECPECMKEWRSKVLSKARQQADKALLNYGFNVLDQKVTYWVGSDFREFWSRQKTVPDSIPDPTVGATCVHGNLCLDEKKRCQITPEMWNWVLAHCTKVEHIFPSDTTQPCEQCLETEAFSRLQNKEYQHLKKQLLEEMKTWPRPSSDPWNLRVGIYTVVPIEWFISCEKYISGSSGKIPGPVNFQKWNCEHNRSVLSIETVKAMFFTKAPMISLIPADSWEVLVGMFGCRGTPVTFSVIEKKESFFGSRSSTVAVDPVYCEHCREKTPLFYRAKTLTIHDADASLLSFSKSKEITVDSDFTIETVRLFACQLFGIEPEWQKLVCNKRTLLDDTRTLADYAIYPGDCIILSESKYPGQYSNITEKLPVDEDQEPVIQHDAGGFRGSAFDGTSL